jgi:predicted RNA-binding Zn-ribbon protein involved in translation (DUF1610 family)
MNEQGTGPAAGSLQSGWKGGCPHCGAANIVSGLEFNLNAEVGPWGLSYKAFGPFRGTEKVCAELCTSCGTVVRIYVNEPNRNWYRKEPKITH